MAWLPKVRVAACNVSPVFLDAPATARKTVSLIAEASRNGAQLVCFPETYIPGFPLWAGIAAPTATHALFRKYAQHSLIAPDGPELKAIAAACKQHGVAAHVGFSERSKASLGCLYNSSLLIDNEGHVRIHHRKLAPTFWEKLIWAPAPDARGLKVAELSLPDGKKWTVGGLICGENTNPLSKFSLMAQGEMFHVTSWPGAWPTRSYEDDGGANQYDMTSANLIRTAAHCFEAKCFGVMVSSAFAQDCYEALAKAFPETVPLLDQLKTKQSGSGFVDPKGKQFGDVVKGGEEGIGYADCDLNECVEPKLWHDVVGGYQRWDIFDLKVKREVRGVEGMFGERVKEKGDNEDVKSKEDVF